jgi:tetratricopeptide (TPR) repeat protein
VFWVHASSQARFEEGYKKIADRVKLQGWDEPKADILRLVSSWLSDESNGRWVMIVDNADEAGVFFNLSTAGLTTGGSSSIPALQPLSNYLPQSQNGSILITSRRRDAAFKLTGNKKDIIAVEPMDEGHALALIRKKLGSDSDNKDAAELARSLDYMPLAITQAAAYISQRAPRFTVSRYLKDFHTSDKGRASLLKKDEGDNRRDGTASNSIIATWQISFEHIRKERPSAARLLSLMSLFDRQGIPEDLLGKLEAAHSEVDAEANTDTDLDEDIFTLMSYSLIGSNIEGNMFEMHRLVQFSTKKWLELSGELERWKEVYIRILNEAFPGSGYENWTVSQALFPHAQVLVACRPLNRKYLLQWAAILDKAAIYASDKGSYIVGEQMEREALASRGEVLGKEHPDTLGSMNNLAGLLESQGKYNEAEPMYRKTLALMKKVLGKEHPNTLGSMNNLALLLKHQGKYDEAEPMYRQTLAAREKVLGKEHPATLTSMNNLAGLLNRQGKYDEICSTSPVASVSPRSTPPWFLLGVAKCTNCLSYRETS